MKKWSFILLLLMAACSNETPVPGPEPPDGGPSFVGEQEVAIKIAFPNEEKTNEPSSYAGGDGVEYTVNSLDIFAFLPAGDKDDPSDDVFLYRAQATKITDASDKSVKNVTASLERKAQRQRFVLIANMPPALTNALTLTEESTTQADLVSQLSFDGSSYYGDQVSKKDILIPMWGQKADSVLISSESVSLYQEPFSLIRAMAKVDVTVASTLQSDFTIEAISAYQVGKSGNIAPDESEWGKTVMTKINAISEREATPYTFESSPVYLLESDTIDSKPAFLVLKATYKNVGSYYRVNFSNNGTGLYPLLRNHAYTINIVGVISNGYSSLEEAEKAPMWNESLIIDNSNLNINDVVYLENQYLLGVNVSSMLFDWDKTWVGKQSAGDESTDYFPLNVYTTYSGGWKATLSDGSWAMIEDATGTANASGIIKITATDDNKTGEDRDAKVTITAGMLTKEVTIRQSGGANSRIIAIPSGAASATTEIPLAFADIASGGAVSGLGADDNIVARVIWQETGSGLSSFNAELNVTDKTIKVTATPGYGNAVVALVRKGTGIPMVGGKDEDVILWSWHIWSMPEGQDVDAGFHNPNTPVFMKRVLGKGDINKGMFYQWGRKTPFPADPASVSPQTSIEDVKNADNIFTAIKHPAIFYKGATDWTGTSPSLTVGELWKDTKTYYDPCPVGWKMPVESDRAYWTVDSAPDEYLNGGLLSTTGVWDDSGGTVWTASGSGNAWLLENTGYLTGTNPTDNINSGHSVRCIKDIQLIKTN